MTRKTIDNILSAIEVSYYAFNIILLAWILISYIDIIWDNAFPNPQHFSWNFFIVVINYFMN